MEKIPSTPNTKIVLAERDHKAPKTKWVWDVDTVRNIDIQVYHYVIESMKVRVRGAFDKANTACIQVEWGY